MIVFNRKEPTIDIERGADALAALQHRQSRTLQAIRARATFRPVREQDIVPVLPCGACGDGGLRAMGRVRGRGRWQRIHACDTCGALQLYDLPEASPPR